MKKLRTAALIVVLIPVAMLLAAIGLVFTQTPGAERQSGGLDFSAAIESVGAAAPPSERVRTRDGAALSYRDFPTENAAAPLLILIHGSGWHGLQFAPLARHLAAMGAAHVVVPDLRGHGWAPQRRGDVDYVGQLEDDLADLIAAQRKDGQRVVLGGHSSGGGLVVRFAGGPHGAMIDEAVLLAPFLKYNAPNRKA